MANRTCSAPDCDDPVKAQGLCNAHYRRMQRRGTLELERHPAGTCSVADCGERTVGQGLCNRHYRMQRKYGDPLYAPPTVPDIDIFWTKVDKNGPIPEHCPELGPCWVWTGGCDESGYGLFYYHDESGRTRRTRAHRWLLGHLRGKPLSREVVGEEDGCHHCDNPPCCNPAHLRVGTRKQNIADAVERERLRQQKVTHCPKCGAEYAYNPSGKHRRCKKCESEQQRIARTVNRKKCKNGHDLEGDNVLLCKNGTRKCRICEAARLEKAHPGFTYQP